MSELSLFDVLRSIGASVEEVWQGEWTGPILFKDSNGANRLILVTEDDHQEVKEWNQNNLTYSSDEVIGFAQKMLVKMCMRPVPLEEYE
jgi:hypothetical protein